MVTQEVAQSAWEIQEETQAQQQQPYQ